MFEPLLLRSAVQICVSYAALLQMNQMAGNKENRGVSKTNFEGAVAVTYFDPNENARNCWQLYRCVARALAAVGVIVISLSGTRTRLVGGTAEPIARLSSS